MSESRIRVLIETRLNNWAAARSPALSIAWENHEFTIPATTYLAGFMLPSRTSSEDLKSAHRAYLGIYQVDVVAPLGDGSGTAVGIAEEIADLFPDALRLTIASPAFAVQLISPCSLGPAQKLNNRYTLPVSFRYRADTF